MGREVIARYREFVESLPPSERDLPYLKGPAACEETFLTPNQVLAHLERRDACGKRLQAMEEELIK